MKTLNFPRVFILLFSLLIISCGGSDEPTESNNNNNSVTNISISSNVTTLLVNESVTFSVITNLNTDVTPIASIKVDGTSISGNVFTPNDDGVFSVSATFDGLTSNTITIVVNPLLTSIVLEASNSDIYLGDDIEFTVTGNNGENLTSQSIISYLNSDIGGSSYTTTSTGIHEFVAAYDTYTSNTLQVTVQEPPTKFNKRVLIEDYTGTWCGYCPRVAYGIELVKAQTTDAVSVAIHRGSTSSSSSSYDPYNYSAGTLEDLINLEGYPTAMLNRTTIWNYPEPNNVSQVTDLASDDADLGLALTPSINGNTITLDVQVKFGGLFTSTNAKLVVYVLEDGLNFYQVNYTSYYGGQDPITNFQHNDVLRASLTDLLGDTIPSSEIVADNVYTKSFSVAVPSNVANASNMTVVAFVVDGNSNAALNVRAAHFGDTQTLEEL